MDTLAAALGVVAFPRDAAFEVVAFPRALAFEVDAFPRALGGATFAREVAVARTFALVVAERLVGFADFADLEAVERFAGLVDLAGLAGLAAVERFVDFAGVAAPRVAAEGFLLDLLDARVRRTLGLFVIFFAAMLAT